MNYYGYYTAFKIILFCRLFYMLKGEIDITIDAPKLIKIADRVELSCSMNYPKFLSPNDHCAMWWSKPGDHERNSEKVLSKDDDIAIRVIQGKNKRPEKSLLIIPHMSQAWEGRYSCHVWCSKLMETGTITLTISNDDPLYDILGDKASVLGAIVTIVAIFFICVASCCCVTIEFCKRDPVVQRSSNTPSDCEDTQLFDNSSMSSSLTLSSTEPPPRYSLVVVSSSGCNDNVNIIPTEVNPECRNSRLLNAIVDEDISGLFVIPSPPPNYRQALMNLAEKGIIFNPESLRPPPPSYDELLEIDVESPSSLDTSYQRA